MAASFSLQNAFTSWMYAKELEVFLTETHEDCYVPLMDVVRALPKTKDFLNNETPVVTKVSRRRFRL